MTGCSGYVGSYLVPELLDRGHEVVGVDRSEWSGEQDFRFHQSDLLETEAWSRALDGVDQVVHLAAAKADWGLSEQEYRRDNVEATRTLLNHGRRAGVTYWFFYSTVATMGPSGEPVGEGSGYSPRGPYGATKMEAERLFQERVGADPSCRLMILRPSVIFGPEHPDSTNVNRLIQSLRTRRFVMVGDGDVVKSTSYIENVVAASLFLMDSWDLADTYVYVDEPQMTTKALVREVCRLLGRSTPRIKVPRVLASTVAAPLDIVGNLLNVDFPVTKARIDKFCRPTHYDASKIRQIGFQQPIDMKTALERTVAWHLGYDVGTQEI